jgi:hypothetical protein
MSQKKKTGKEFEQMIHRIYQELLPYADVRWNDFIMGKNSKIERQIDISVRHDLAGHEILMVIQAKDLKRSADVIVVDAFKGVIEDVGAQKGILICNTGFTKSAKESAKSAKIDVCSAHDASKINWQTEIKVPVLKKSVSVKMRVNNTYVRTGDGNVMDVQSTIFSKALSIFVSKWESDEIPKNEGENKFVLDNDALAIDKNVLWPLVTEVNYNITYRYHFKFFSPIDYRGIKDYVTENFNPSFIQFDEKIPFLNDGSWEYVPDPKKIPLNTLHLDIEVIRFDLLKQQAMRVTLKK